MPTELKLNPAALGPLYEAMQLALEYWAHRQQRYKNRSPVWVGDARDAIALAESAGMQPPSGAMTLERAEEVREAAEQAKMLLGGGVASYETPAGVVIARAYEILHAALGVK